MGVCTSDVYLAIKKDHGELFKKYIVGSESLLFIKREMKIKLEELDKRVERKKQTLHSEVNQREEMAIYHFKETKQSLDGSLPGGCHGYEQMKKVSIDIVLGLPQIKNHFSKIHEEINKEIRLRKDKVHAQLEEIVLEAQKEYKIDPQKMKNFHDMSQEKRTYIRQRGIQQFQLEIKTKINQFQRKYVEQLFLPNQMKNFDNIITLQKVDQLVRTAENKFKTEASHITGDSIQSTIKI